MLGQRHRIALLRRPLGERAQDVAQVAQRDPFLDEAPQHVGQQHGRDQLGHHLAHQRGVRPLQRVEQRLRLLAARTARGRSGAPAPATSSPQARAAPRPTPRAGSSPRPSGTSFRRMTNAVGARPGDGRRAGARPAAAGPARRTAARAARHDLGHERAGVARAARAEQRAQLARDLDGDRRQHRRGRALGRARAACARPAGVAPAAAAAAAAVPAPAGGARSSRHAIRPSTAASVRNGIAGQPGHDGQQHEQPGRDRDRLRLRHHLHADVAPQVAALLLRGDAGDDDAGRRRDHQRRDLRHQALADRQHRVRRGPRPRRPSRAAGRRSPGRRRC